MREILTFLAIGLVLLLSAALGLPYFIHWNDYRDTISLLLEQELHQSVFIGGDIKVRLLPVPILDVEQIQIGPNAGPQSFSATKLHGELSLLALIGGERRVSQLELEEPRLQLHFDQIGHFFNDANPMAASIWKFETILIHHGQINLIDAQGGIAFDAHGIEAQGSAGSLTGPFKGAASFDLADDRLGERIVSHFTTGLLEESGLKLKISVDSNELMPNAEINGVLALQDISTDSNVTLPLPVFNGTIVLNDSFHFASGSQDWRLSGKLYADSSEIKIDEGECELGSSDRKVILNTSIDWPLESKKRPVGINFSAKQIDFNKLDLPEFSPKDFWSEGTNPPKDIIVALTRRLPLPINFDIKFETPMLLWHGENFSTILLHYFRSEPGPIHVDLAGQGPGQSVLHLDGQLAGERGTKFFGTTAITVLDLPGFAQFLREVYPSVGQQISKFPFRKLALLGQVEITPLSAALQSLQLQLDQSQFTGTIVLAEKSSPLARSSLSIELQSDSLDIDHLPDLSTLINESMIQSYDWTINFGAKAVRFAQRTIDSGYLHFLMHKNLDQLEIDQFSIEQFGGADLAITGHLNADHGNLQFNLRAKKLTELAHFLMQVAPGNPFAFLASQADRLAPAAINLSVEVVKEQNQQWMPRQAQLDGQLAQTRIEGMVSPSSGHFPLEAHMRIANPDGGALLAQLGYAVVGLRDTGQAFINVDFKTLDESQGDLSASAEISGTRGFFIGRLAKNLVGDWHVESKNFLNLLAVLGKVVVDSRASLPVDLRGQITNFGGGSFQLSNIDAFVGTIHAKGFLEKDNPSAPFKGELSIDHLSLETIALLQFGGGLSLDLIANDLHNDQWSTAKFGAGFIDAPAAIIRLVANDMRYYAGLHGPAHFTLKLGGDQVVIEDLQAKVASGTLTGNLAFRHIETQGSVNGHLDLKTIAIDLPQLKATASATMDFAGTGESPAHLIENLNGQGDAELENILIPQANSQALSKVIAAADAGEIEFDQVALKQAVQKALEVDDASFDRLRFAIRAAAGLVYITSNDLSFIVDFRNFIFEEKLRLALNNPPKDWKNPGSAITMGYRGAWVHPEYRLDIDAFFNDLAARAIDRETQRVKTIEEDIKERAYVNRYLKGMRHLQQDDIDYQNYLAEEKRKADEATLREQINQIIHDSDKLKEPLLPVLTDKITPKRRR